MSLQLEGKTALITGAASGIGRAVAVRCLSEGANVVAFDRVESSPGCDLQAGAYASVIGDVRSAADNQRAVDLAVSRFGRLDVFVGNAGLYDNRRAFRTFSAPELDAAFDELFGVNVKGYPLGALAAADIRVNAVAWPAPSQMPLQTLPTADDFGAAYVFLASDACTRTATGTVLAPDGGAAVRGPRS